MRKMLTTALLLFAGLLWAQPDTEVYLMDVVSNNGKTELVNLRNISNNLGYDNQPSFYDNNTIIYSRTRNGQTDIAKYNIKTGETSWVSDTSFGSEYSPLRIPDSKHISAVRLDTSGLQRLYRYKFPSGKSKEILKDLKVGYHVWLDSKRLFTTVLTDNRMDLLFNNLTEKSNTLIKENVGRSLHKIPNVAKEGKNDQKISFISNYQKTGMLESYNPLTKTFKELVGMKKRLQDYCWLPNGSILIPEGNQLLQINPEKDDMSQPFYTFEDKNIYKVSRIAISPDEKHIALVSIAPPEIIVQKQVESFNTENLDAFASCYAENVSVLNFPNDTLSLGNAKLKSNYKRYFENSPKTTVEVVKRIQIGDFVIDEENVKRSGKTHHQAAIYNVVNAKIESMTFIHDIRNSENPEPIVQKQLDAYNTRDINAFLNTYSEDIGVFDFPNRTRYTGKDKMRERYSGFFEITPDLHCELKNRIVIGNKVIDEEFITTGSYHFKAVAIYEVENGKISKVTFIQ